MKKIIVSAAIALAALTANAQTGTQVLIHEVEGGIAIQSCETNSAGHRFCGTQYTESTSIVREERVTVDGQQALEIQVCSKNLSGYIACDRPYTESASDRVAGN